jgi:hypothetical protein
MKFNKKTETEKVIHDFIAENNKDKDGEPINRVVPIRVDLIDICKGDLNAGIMLVQIIYWTDRGAKKNNGWIYKSAREFYDETRLTDKRVKNGTKNLKKLGLVDVKNKVARGHNTRWYKLNINETLKALGKLYNERSGFNEVLDQKADDLDLKSITLDQRMNEGDLKSNYTESIIESTEITTDNLKDKVLNKKHLELPEDIQPSNDGLISQSENNNLKKQLKSLFKDDDIQAEKNQPKVENLIFNTNSITETSPALDHWTNESGLILNQDEEFINNGSNLQSDDNDSLTNETNEEEPQEYDDIKIFFDTYVNALTEEEKRELNEVIGYDCFSN